MTQQATFKPDKDHEYRSYLIWKSLPRDISPELYEKLGISDELIQELASIKTQQQFAEAYNLERKTLTRWNQKPIPEEYKELDWRYWARQATPAVASAFLREATKQGDAARFTAWMKYVEQVEEKSIVKVDGMQDLFDNVKALLEKD